MVLIWLAIVTPAFAATTPAAPYIVDACRVPVYVQLRIAAHADVAERSYGIESCGSGRDLKHVVPDGSLEALSLSGERGELNVRLQLHEGDKTLAYEALAVMPSASERTLQRLGHSDGPDVAVTTTRDTYRDLLTLHVANVPAQQVADDIARVKGLHIDGIEHIDAKSRVTFNWDAIPLRTVLTLLGEVSYIDIVRTGERDYVANPPYHRFPAEWKPLHAAHEKAAKADQAAIEDKMLAVVGEPQRREDIQPFQLGALYTLRSWADDRHDTLRAIAAHRRIVALLKLRSYDAERDVEYADALAQLAKALAQHEETAEASTLLAQAVAIIERTDGPQSSSLTKPLLQQAALAQRRGMKVSAHDTLARAIALAELERRPLALLQLGSVQTEEGHYDELVATLDRVYALLPKDGRRAEEIEVEYGLGTNLYDSFKALEHKAILHLPADKAESHHRCLVATAAQWYAYLGVVDDNWPTAFETYMLGRNLLDQGKFNEAASQLQSSLSFAAKQPAPQFFYADAFRYLTMSRLQQHDFAAAAHAWQDMAALRAKVYGSHHVRVALTLRESGHARTARESQQGCAGCGAARRRSRVGQARHAATARLRQGGRQYEGRTHLPSRLSDHHCQTGRAG